MIVSSSSKGRYGRIDRTQSLEILSLNHNVNTIQCSTIQYNTEKKRKKKKLKVGLTLQETKQRKKNRDDCPNVMLLPLVAPLLSSSSSSDYCSTRRSSLAVVYNIKYTYKYNIKTRFLSLSLCFSLSVCVESVSLGLKLLFDRPKVGTDGRTNASQCVIRVRRQ